MTQRQQEVRQRREKWSAIIGRYEASGLTRDVFAAREGVNSGTLYWWILRLRKETGSKHEVVTPKTSPLSSAAFIPVRVVPPGDPLSSRRGEAGGQADETGSCVELVVSQGSVMRLDPERLSERGVALLAVLAKELCR
jgi:hypothetical protein